MSYMGIVICLVALVHLCVVPGAAGPVTSRAEAMEHMKKYYYMGHNNPDKHIADMSDNEAYDKALLHYQTQMGLNATGILDTATSEMMGKSRCGMPDVLTMRDMTRRRKRYAIQGYRWSADRLTYRFNSFTADLSQTDTERIIAAAFKMWSDVTPLQFDKVDSNSRADIEIEFVARSHGDDDPFDGPGNVLAHAYFPNFGGDAHFDEDEEFTDRTVRGINLLFVAVHEFGHSLGLSHSAVQDAIMFPTYLAYRENLKLHADDIDGIRVLYGEETVVTRTAATATTTTTSTATPPSVDIRQQFCDTGTVDAIGVLGGQTYAFQGNIYARLHPEVGISPGYPRQIQDDWPGLPNNVDGALNSGSYLDIYKGDQLWSYTVTVTGRFILQAGYPQSLLGLGLPSGVDMAFEWIANGRAYAFKGSDYYRLNADRTGIDATYPRPVSIWNLPSQSFTAAFSAQNRRTFFFFGKQYYRYNDMNMQPDSGYPQSTSERWFGCSGDVMEMGQNPDQIPDVPPVSSSVKVTWSIPVVLLLTVTAHALWIV